MDIANFGRLHVQLLHFPIALTLAAVLADLLYLLLRKAPLKAAGYYCIVFAAVMAVPTVAAGWLLMEDFEDAHKSAPAVDARSGQAASGAHVHGDVHGHDGHRTGDGDSQVGRAHDMEIGELHETLGLIAGIIVALAGVIRLVLRNNMAKWRGLLYGATVAAAAAMVVTAAHVGGKFAFGADYLRGVLWW